MYASKQKGGLSVGAMVGLTVAALLVGGIVFIVSSYFSYANEAVDYETRIERGVEDNKQILGQYRIKVREMAQVADMQAEDFEKVFVKAIDARYKNGMGQMMAWIKEQNPQLGTEVYTNLQRAMDAGRSDFTAAQTRLLDVCRGYSKLQRQPYSGFWVRVTGHPSTEFSDKGDMGKLCRAVTSAGAQEAFESGVEEPVKLRNKPEGS